MWGPYLSSPELRPLVQAVDEASGQADVVPHHGAVLGQPVDGAHAAAQVPVDHGGQLTVPELRRSERVSASEQRRPPAGLGHSP